MKRITLFLLAFVAGVALAREPVAADPKMATAGNNCNESKGEVWTCTIQCDPGVRKEGNLFPGRLMSNTPGVEMCAVRSCTCAANWSNNWPDKKPHRPGFLAQDTADELAVVVFGLDRLMGVLP